MSSMSSPPRRQHVPLATSLPYPVHARIVGENVGRPRPLVPAIARAPTASCSAGWRAVKERPQGVATGLLMHRRFRDARSKTGLVALRDLDRTVSVSLFSKFRLATLTGKKLAAPLGGARGKGEPDATLLKGHPGQLSRKREQIHDLTRGKPSERVGRKATGLSPGGARDTVAGLPGERRPWACGLAHRLKEASSQ